jgi:hypothetical protein
MRSDGKYIETSVTSDQKGGKGGSGFYSEEWKVLDPAATRDRYLFEYYQNGVHLVQKDWCIDDNRVVNSKDETGEGLKLFNITINPTANGHLGMRASKVDKPTYDYYNMYEKIVRGLIGPGSVTPYNPVSNFSGKRTVGNFRAVSFSYVAAVTPPTPCAVSKGGAAELQFAASPTDPTTKAPFFVKYHLYSASKTGVDHTSSKQADITTTAGGKGLVAALQKLSGTTYFRLQVEDKDGAVSPLSPEVSVDPSKDVDGCGGGSTPTTPCPSDLKAKCDPKTDKPCKAKDGKTYTCSAKGTWTPQSTPTSMTCGGVTKQCDEIYDGDKGQYCNIDGAWWQCKDGKWVPPGTGK